VHIQLKLLVDVAKNSPSSKYSLVLSYLTIIDVTSVLLLNEKNVNEFTSEIYFYEIMNNLKRGLILQRCRRII